MKPLHAITTTLVVLFAVILLVAIGMMLQTSPSETTNNPQNPSNGTPQTPQEPVLSFETTDKNDWPHTERAEAAIQSLAAGQIISPLILKDPSQEHIYYFTADVYTEETDENLISIYKYNTADYTWERLFRQSYKEGTLTHLNNQLLPVIHAVGIDNDKLILLAMGTDDSPGPCSSPLLIAEEGGDMRALLSMNLNEPYAGFTKYNAPTNSIQEAQAASQTCMSQM